VSKETCRKKNSCQIREESRIHERGGQWKTRCKMRLGEELPKVGWRGTRMRLNKRQMEKGQAKEKELK
jgi:hypothetical protein